MKKETSIAIGMGIVFGLIFSFVLILNTQKNQSVTSKQSTQKKTITADVEKNMTAQPLTITSPVNGAILDKNAVSLEGKTEEGSFVVIQTPANDVATTAQGENFSASVPLSLGENVIHVSSYPKGSGGKIQEKELRVYYLSSTN